MPRYDYQCDDCGHGFELKQSFHSEPYADCPKCQGNSRRQFHSVPIVFKGSGWYVNDYGKRGSGSTTSPDSKETSDSSKTKSESESKAETKSDSTSPEKTKAASSTAKASDN